MIFTMHQLQEKCSKQHQQLNRVFFYHNKPFDLWGGGGKDYGEILHGSTIPIVQDAMLAGVQSLLVYQSYCRLEWKIPLQYFPHFFYTS